LRDIFFPDALPGTGEMGGVDSDASSTSTELCDDPGAASDVDVEELPASVMTADAVLIHVEEVRGEAPSDLPSTNGASPSPAVSPASPSVEATSTDERSTFSEMSMSLSADNSLKLSPIPSDSVSDSTFTNEDWLGDTESATLVDSSESAIERTLDFVSNDFFHVDGDSCIKSDSTVKLQDRVVKGDGDVNLVEEPTDLIPPCEGDGVKLADSIVFGDTSWFISSDSTRQVVDGDGLIVSDDSSRLASSDIRSRYAGDVKGEHADSMPATGDAIIPVSSSRVDGDVTVDCIRNNDWKRNSSEDRSESDTDKERLRQVNSNRVGKGDCNAINASIERDNSADNNLTKLDSFDRLDPSGNRSDSFIKSDKVTSVDQSESVKSGDLNLLKNWSPTGGDMVEQTRTKNEVDENSLVEPAQSECLMERSSVNKQDSTCSKENFSDLLKNSGFEFKHVADYSNNVSENRDSTEKLLGEFRQRSLEKSGDTADSTLKSDRDLFSISDILVTSEKETGKTFEPSSTRTSYSRASSNEKPDLKSISPWLSSISRDSQETGEVTPCNVEDSGYSSVSAREIDPDSVKKLPEEPLARTLYETANRTSKPSEDDWSKADAVGEELRREEDHPELKMWRPPDRDRDCLSDASSRISPVRVPSSTSSVIDSDECRGTDWSRMSSRETYSERGITRQMSEYRDVSPGPEDDSSEPRRHMPLQTSLTQESDEFNLSSDTGSSKDSKDRPIVRLFRREESVYSNDDKMFIREESIVSTEEDSLRSSALDLGEFGDEANRMTSPVSTRRM